MCRRRETGRQWALRESLEIRDAGVAPPLRFLLLDRQKCTDLRETLRVDVLLEISPRTAHLANYLDAMRVAMHQLVPEDATRRSPVIPGQVMKPEQELLGSLAHVGKSCRNLRAVLRGCVAALGTAIEADALGVGAMVVSRV